MRRQRIDEEFHMMRSLCLALGVLSLVLGACGSEDGSATHGGPIGAGGAGGSGGGGGWGGVSGFGGGGSSDPASTTTTSFEGTWLVTQEPSQLLRYADGASSPADVIELGQDP